MYIAPSPPSRATGLERLSCLKYYNVLKRENRSTLGLNAAKNSDYMKKKKTEVKFIENLIPYKILCGGTSLSPPNIEPELEGLPCLKYYNVQK